jgi:hypothetical protein
MADRDGVQEGTVTVIPCAHDMVLRQIKSLLVNIEAHDPEEGDQKKNASKDDVLPHHIMS